MTRSEPVKLSRTAAILLALALVTAGAVLGYLLLPAGTGHSPATGTAGAPPGPVEPPARSTPGGDAVVSISPDAAERAGIVVERVRAAGPSALRIPATVEPNAYQQVVVTPVAGGRVTRVSAALGDRVRRGQTLASVYSPELADAQSRLIAVRAELQASEQELRRTEKLVEIGAASRQELERIEAAHAGRLAAVDGARSRLVLLGMPATAADRLTAGAAVSASLDIPAPIDGIVTERGANVGLNVDPSTPLFTVVDLSRVWIVGDLFERDVARVATGGEATVTVAASPGRTYAGKVTYIDPQVNPATRTARVRVEVANADGHLRLGMLAEVSIALAGGGASVIVPRDAVQIIGDRHVVYVPDPAGPGRYLERTVRTGAASGSDIEILEGLEPDESIVTRGSFHLRAERERLGPSLVREPVESVRVEVNAQGFSPARVPLPASRATRITFLRTEAATCATEIVFPAFEIRHPLPLDEPVVVTLPPHAAGEVTFVCGMDMVRGVAVFTEG